MFSHPFPNVLVGHSHNTLLGCNPFIAFLCLLHFYAFCRVWLIRVRKENVRGNEA